MSPERKKTPETNIEGVRLPREIGLELLEEMKRKKLLKEANEENNFPPDSSLPDYVTPEELLRERGLVFTNRGRRIAAEVVGAMSRSFNGREIPPWFSWQVMGVTLLIASGVGVRNKEGGKKEEIKKAIRRIVGDPPLRVSDVSVGPVEYYYNQIYGHPPSELVRATLSTDGREIDFGIWFVPRNLSSLPPEKIPLALKKRLGKETNSCRPMPIIVVYSDGRRVDILNIEESLREMKLKKIKTTLAMVLLTLFIIDLAFFGQIRNQDRLITANYSTVSTVSNRGSSLPESFHRSSRKKSFCPPKERPGVSSSVSPPEVVLPNISPQRALQETLPRTTVVLPVVSKGEGSLEAPQQTIYLGENNSPPSGEEPSPELVAPSSEQSFIETNKAEPEGFPVITLVGIPSETNLEGWHLCLKEINFKNPPTVIINEITHQITSRQGELTVPVVKAEDFLEETGRVSLWFRMFLDRLVEGAGQEVAPVLIEVADPSEGLKMLEVLERELSDRPDWRARIGLVVKNLSSSETQEARELEKSFGEWHNRAYQEGVTRYPPLIKTGAPYPGLLVYGEGVLILDPTTRGIRLQPPSWVETKREWETIIVRPFPPSSIASPEISSPTTTEVPVETPAISSSGENPGKRELNSSVLTEGNSREISQEPPAKFKDTSQKRSKEGWWREVFRVEYNLVELFPPGAEDLRHNFEVALGKIENPQNTSPLELGEVELVLPPGARVVFWRDPRYPSDVIITNGLTPEEDGGYREAGGYYGGGVCSLASILYHLGLSTPGLNIEERVVHYNQLPGIPWEYGSGILTGENPQNLVMRNCNPFPIRIRLVNDGEKISGVVEQLNLTPNDVRDIVNFYRPQLKTSIEEIFGGVNSQPDPDLVMAMLLVESCGNPCAVSWVGAEGLLQVMPDHFEEGTDHFSAFRNISTGLNVLKYFYEQYLNMGFSPDEAMKEAVKGYNGGFTEPRPEETENYFRLVMEVYGKLKEEDFCGILEILPWCSFSCR